MNDYKKVLVQVDEILNYLPSEDFEKIPEDVRDLIKNYKDKDYVWKYDVSKELKNQDVDRDTIAFLSYLNMEYLLNEEQKTLMNQIHELNERKLEKEKSEKYDINNIFKNDIDKSKITEQPKIETLEKNENTLIEKYIFKINKKIEEFSSSIFLLVIFVYHL